MLGTFSVKGKKKTVCACKDFTVGGKRLFDFCSMKNTILDSDSNGSGTELEDILDTIEKQQYIAPDVLCEHFWDMFIDDISAISDLHKEFYKQYLNARYHLMIRPAYELALAEESGTRNRL